MHEPQTWRELLGQSINDSPERQRIANELGVNPVTLTRWIKGEGNPRPQHLGRLLDALPMRRELLLTLIKEEFEDFTIAGGDYSLASESAAIPIEFYARVIHTRATLSKELHFWSLCDLILRQALQQLDPHRLGMAIIVVRCMPPSHGQKVRSLREVIGCGTPPWERSLEQDLILLGAESLAGYAVSLGHLIVNQKLREESSWAPGYPVKWEESAAAAPILFAGGIAGSLLVSSTQCDYFLPSRCALIESYAELIALAFEQEEFYEEQQIALGAVPSYEEQRSYFSRFRQRVLDIMMQAKSSQQSMTFVQAELLAWQQLEEELLQPSSYRQ